MSLVERNSRLPALTIPDAPQGDTIFGAIRHPALVGALVAVAFFGALAAWSVLAPLTGAVIALGKIAPEGTTRTVQHLEGGIVSQILVKEGQFVGKGGPLIELQDVAARSSYEQLLAQDLALMIRQSRLTAEHLGEEEWDFHAAWDDSLAGGLLHEVGTSGSTIRPDDKYIEVERHLFGVRHELRRQEEGIYTSRIEQLRLAIAGLEDQNRELANQRALLEQEIAGTQSLYGRGLESLPRLLSLKRIQHQLLEREAQNRGRIAEIREQIGDFTLRRLNAESRRQEEVNNQLTEIQANRAVLARQMAAARDVMVRTLIAAPVSGVVTNIRAKTIGSVLSPGATILDLVPKGEPMIIEAKISPNDIDNVHVGQNALIQLSAYPFRSSDPLAASVETVSADIVEDLNPPETYYVARLRVEEAAMADLPPEIEMTPGMPVDVFITTDRRTAVSYLLEPIFYAMRRALREP